MHLPFMRSIGKYESYCFVIILPLHSIPSKSNFGLLLALRFCLARSLAKISMLLFEALGICAGFRLTSSCLLQSPSLHTSGHVYVGVYVRVCVSVRMCVCV
eukprot:scpid110709/ scgid10132/ 